MKYTSGGDLVWVAAHGIGYEAVDIAVDVAGNVVVAGVSNPAYGKGDFLTLKYSAAGDTLWTAWYDGPTKKTDTPVALALDAAGNIYVAGQTEVTLQTKDFAIVKYDPEGGFLGDVTYDRGNGNDVLADLALDTGVEVHVLVCGQTRGSGSREYATVCYNADLQAQWAAYYDGDPLEDDIPYGMATDAKGNVYVTGKSGDALRADYATIKYDWNGQEKWVRRYNGPGDWNDEARAITLDLSGNVYVTGKSESMTKYGYATVKYDTAGNEQWISRYENPESAGDMACALAVSESGILSVTGEVSTGGKSDYGTVRYDLSGMQRGAASTYSGSGNCYDRPAGLCLDSQENTLMTGMSQSSTTMRDYATVKFGPNAEDLWNGGRYFDGLSIWPASLSWHDWAYAVCVGPTGNVYVTGACDTMAFSNMVTVKYDAAGNQLWARWYSGPGGTWDTGYFLGLDAMENLYVGGSSYGAGTGLDYVVVKYDPAGNEQWVRRYDGASSGHDYLRGMAVDDEGTVVVTGTSTIQGGSSTDYLTVTYSPSGDERWHRVLDSSATSDDAVGLALDKEGNVYVAGSSYAGVTGKSNYLTVKYSAGGLQQWVAVYDGPSGRNDWASAVALDPTGSVVVTGISEGATTGDDMATIKYSSAGDSLWCIRTDTLGNADEHPLAMTVDDSGAVYITGTIEAGGNTSMATVKYDALGAMLWVAGYDGRGWDELPVDIGVAASGGVYVLSESSLPGGVSATSSWSLIKYTDRTVSSVERREGAPYRYALGQNYPNPFNPSTLIPFSLPSASRVHLAVFDLLGREVQLLVDEQLAAGSHSVAFDASALASGVYLYRLTAGAVTQTRRMILLR